MQAWSYVCWPGEPGSGCLSSHDEPWQGCSNGSWGVDTRHVQCARAATSERFARPSRSLRCLAQATAAPLLSAEAMIAAAGKLDLVNNVFQNGVHGSLRNTLVDVRASLHRSLSSVSHASSAAAPLMHAAAPPTVSGPGAAWHRLLL